MADNDVENLLSVLVQCFSLILAGYVSGRTGLIGEQESSGIAAFVSYFSLPALIFQSLATLAFGNICWTFVSGILVSKILVFIAVAAITMILTRPCDTSVAGLFAIFCTQSNDFAVGYPIISSLYSVSQPLYADYLYVLAPIQLLILNPAGIFMLELDRQLRNASISSRTLLFAVVWGVLKNPVILMTVAGLVWNVTAPKPLPFIMASTLQALGQSFSATALFLLGLNMVGKFNVARGTVTLVVPVLLAVVKILVLPIVIWLVLEHVFNDRASLSMANFGFLYGTIPAAPTVFVFALQYGTEIQTLATSLVLSTTLAAPVMFICANMIRLSDKGLTPSSTEADLRSTAGIVSVVALPLLLWTLCVLLMGRKWRSLTHRVTIIIILWQLLVNVSAILSHYTDTVTEPSRNAASPTTLQSLHMVLSMASVTGVRVWSAILAVTLCLLRLTSLCFVIKFQWLAHVVGAMILIVATAVSSAFLSSENSCSYSSYNCASFQSYVCLVIAILCALISFFGILATQKLLNHAEEDDRQQLVSNASTSPIDVTSEPTPSQSTEEIASTCRTRDVEDIPSFCSRSKSCCQSDACIHRVSGYRLSLSQAVEQGEEATGGIMDRVEIHQLLPHIIFLMTLTLSMSVEIVVLLGLIATEASAGVFLNLQYLNAILVCGQGIFVFLLFGVDADSVSRKLSAGYNYLAQKFRIEDRNDPENNGQLFSRPCVHF